MTTLTKTAGARSTKKMGVVLKNAARYLWTGLLIAGLMLLPGKAGAEGRKQAELPTKKPVPAKTDSEEQKPQFSISYRYLLHKKGSTNSLGAGISTSIPLQRFQINAAIEGVFEDFKTAALGDAMLSVRMQLGTLQYIGQMIIEPTIYCSPQYLGTEFGAGIAVKASRYDITVFPHWQPDNVVAMPVIWSPVIGPMNIMLAVVPIANADVPYPKPTIGFETGVGFRMKKFEIFGSVFTMLGRKEEGGLTPKQENLQIGMKTEL
jgi:hypothetical protein